MVYERILLTGGCGLLGRTLAPMLADVGAVTHFELNDPGDGLPWVQGNLCDAAAVADACRGMDGIVHVAALHGRAWAEAGDDVGFETNVVGTKNVLEGAVRAGVKRVVFTSSIWATGHDTPPAPYLPIDEDLPRQPAEMYGLSKIIGEQMCRYAAFTHGVSTLVIRPGGIRPATAYDPADAGLLFGAVDVRDVAQAHVLALTAREGIRHNVFIITADSPLQHVDGERYKSNPITILDNRVPGVRERVRQGLLTLPDQAEWYTTEKAESILGYQSIYGFRLEPRGSGQVGDASEENVRMAR